jgi:hypothetical protein
MTARALPILNARSSLFAVAVLIISALQGNNEIRAFLKNGQYGGCGANFEVRINGTIIKSLSRTWSLPTERSAPNAVCADETMELNFK